ncbi:hypothetical protein BC833DRAFT_587532 [Globomyces pollinis-pini]|nr:hypothetical protein BC833DRAFT_587532 [Globomyces pollinis-pini]
MERKKLTEMWKATAALPKPAINPAPEDDWDSDPNFVNDVSEKDQRWGNQKTIDDKAALDSVNMADLRKAVQINDKNMSENEWKEKAAATKKSYGAPASK